MSWVHCLMRALLSDGLNIALSFLFRLVEVAEPDAIGIEDDAA
jgi:hypothetical protein